MNSADIKSLYPKDNVRGVVDWINSTDNLMYYVNKEKALRFLSVQSTNLIGYGMKKQSFIATNIIKNFTNPNIPDRNHQYRSPYELREDTGLPVWKVSFFWRAVSCDTSYRYDSTPINNFFNLQTKIQGQTRAPISL